MASFKTSDLLIGNSKYIETLMEVIRTRSEMIIGAKQDGEKIKLRNKIIIGDYEYNVTQRTKAELADKLESHLLQQGNGPPWVVDSRGRQHSLITLYRDNRFLPKSRLRADVRDKAFQQRQESGLVAMINDLTLSGPIQIPGIAGMIYGADAAPEMSKHGKENLVDVVLYRGEHKNPIINVSCKQTKAADLGGGGMAGLRIIVPELIQKLYRQVQIDLREAGFEEGVQYNTKDIPTFVYQIPERYLKQIFRGHEKIGGTIDYMYIGPPDVIYENGKLNGDFISPDDFARRSKFYFRLRTRDVIQGKVEINFSKKTDGFPAIFVTGPAKRNAARFVVEDTPAAAAKKRTL